nr:MAG TPA: hypothetical protein [Caudoviricetes sp.]
MSTRTIRTQKIIYLSIFTKTPQNNFTRKTHRSPYYWTVFLLMSKNIRKAWLILPIEIRINVLYNRIKLEQIFLLMNFCYF